MNDCDVLVVGAGIHGAGVAQAAAAQGYSVVVVDKASEAGSETSSASSKLIHGGLRYLENAEFRLVYECLRERQRLLQNAPHLVRLTPFYIPVYDTHRRRPLWIGLGLSLYWALSGFKRSNRFRRLPRRDWPQLGCREQNLRAVFQYFDGQTDDQALTKAVLGSAQAMGAECYFATALESVSTVDGRLQAQLSSGRRVTCRSLINAAGPWVNQVADAIAGADQQSLTWVQGTHILLNRPAPAGCFYLESPRDGRAVFVLPWQDKTLVGTTEKQLGEPIAQTTPDEVEYLLEVYNSYFTAALASHADIEKTYCGIRVLPAEDGSANVRSRETVFTVQQLAGGLYLAIYGGKLTSYRATADKVMLHVNAALGGGHTPPRSTAHMRLP